MAYGLTQSATLAKTSKYFSVAGGAAVAIGNNFTLEGWFKPSDTGDSYFVGKWADVTVSNCSYFFYYQTNALRLHMASSSTEYESSVSWTPTANTWYHLSVTFASATSKFYVNGVQQGTNQTTVNTSVNTISGTDTNIGTDRATDAGQFNGQASLVRIWTQVQAQATIAANMCTYFGSAQTGMAAEWSLNNVLTDSSGNGLTLTNHGTITFATDTPSTCTIVAVNSGFFRAVMT